MNANAEHCIECGDCESRCPFDVAVIPKMREAASVFAD
jgi:predicted aldo/keto reductase-like oxidoreductase